MKRAGKNPLARKVKFADIEDKLNVLRLQELKQKDLEGVPNITGPGAGCRINP